ncbi:ABC transporter ATP-binding protein [Anaerotruncus rubiinfantis]|uniref:ABC transporter ATP-binding protein n=1 Tax=Anaerotruncus rubiinfantis TaxID=1720200 RepID=UPI00082F305C|nr:ABC transporter ATP-binding protein [Anaerotruncus rubiinfantis]
MHKILEIEDLRVGFHLTHGTSHIVNGLNISLEEGHLIGLVGESGSGKSVSASAALGFVRKPGFIESGRVIFDEKVDLLALSEQELQQYRGSAVGLIAANARGHLNPLMTVGEQISNVYRAHNKCTKKEAWDATLKMLEAVGLTDIGQRAKSYPHELSGGMAQRCMIAMALINSPRVLIADDATNGLDVTVQAQIMDLIITMLRERDMSGIFITHDLGVVAQCCNEIAIMYCGQIVEFAPVEQFYKNPVHPYSRHLLYSLPEYRNAAHKEKMWENNMDPMNLPDGCLFHPRCKFACEGCRVGDIGMVEVEPGHFVKCCNIDAACKTAAAIKGGTHDGQSS